MFALLPGFLCRTLPSESSVQPAGSSLGHCFVLSSSLPASVKAMGLRLAVQPLLAVLHAAGNQYFKSQAKVKMRVWCQMRQGSEGC